MTATFFGCQTSQKNSPEGSPAGMPMTLHDGELINHPFPLPDLRKSSKSWHFDDQSVEKLEAFIAWDFDKDGSPEYVRYYDAKAHTEVEAFDFDQDGQPDVVKRRNLVNPQK
jgi:hypothetical protein